MSESFYYEGEVSVCYDGDQSLDIELKEMPNVNGWTDLANFLITRFDGDNSENYYESKLGKLRILIERVE